MRTRWEATVATPLCETPGDGGGGGGIQGDNGNPNPAAAPSGQPTQTATPAPAAAPSGFTYEEDRSNWIPPHRLREIAEQRRQVERDLEIERQRVAALSGVQRQASAPRYSQQDEALREELFAKFPEIKALVDKQDQLNALVERLGNFDPNQVSTAQDHYFEQMGHMTLARLDESAAATFGELTPFAQQMLHNAFGVWVASDGDRQNRYGRGDQKLVSDFLTEYRTAMIDPARRKATAGQPASGVPGAVTPRQRFPQQGNSAGATLPGRPATLKPNDSDEYHSAAFRSLTGSGS